LLLGRQVRQPERKRLRRQVQQPERKRLQQQVQVRLRQQVQEQEQEQQPVQVRRQALQRVFHRKQLRQGPTGQQQERRVSLSIPWEIKVKQRKGLPGFQALLKKTGMRQKSEAAHSSACI